MQAWDSETTGTDFHFGARPFFLTIQHDDGRQQWFEWDVDPLTREVTVPGEDRKQIERMLGLTRSWRKFAPEVREEHKLVLQNCKFDVKALESIGITGWPWGMTHDTLTAGHLLSSNTPHDLTSMALQYLGEDIQPYEDQLDAAVKEARSICRRDFPEWAIAKEGRPDMPSAKAKKDKGADNLDRVHKFDMWLPRALARELDYPDDHLWWRALSEYSNVDSAVTLALWKVMEAELKRRDLWEIYLECMNLPEVVYDMEQGGITLSRSRLEELTERYKRESAEAEARCVEIAASYRVPCKECVEDWAERAALVGVGSGTKPPPELRGDFYGRAECECDSEATVPYRLELPKGGRNGSLDEFVFGVMRLPVLGRTESGKPALDKSVLEAYESTLQGEELEFITELRGVRSRNTACSYMDSYRRFWLPLESDLSGDTYVLHPNLNITGTDTLRGSSNNPNGQNISAKKNFNLRYCFGPGPDEEWWSFDYHNLELVLPAYECGEEALISLFEKPDEPPYYGSEHILNFSIVYPDIWADVIVRVGEEKASEYIKTEYKSTWYHCCKCGDFACVPMDTLALTRKGWRSYDDLKVGDEVLGYVSPGELIWTPVLEKVKYEDAPLVTISHKHFSATITPDHRWVCLRRTGRGRTRRTVEEFGTTRGLTKEHSIILSAPVADEPLLNVTSEEAAIIGFAYSDGSVVRSKKGHGPARGRNGEKVGFCVRLYQSKERGIGYIEELLSRWGGKFSKCKLARGMYIWEIDSEQVRNIWKRAGLWEEENFELFVLRLGTESRVAFLRAVWEAEGTIGAGEDTVYTQNAGPFAEAIRLAIFMGGSFATSSIKRNYYPTDNACWDFRASKPYVTGQKLKRDYFGHQDVWCVRTDLHSWVMRQGDLIMLTGNCGYGAIDRPGGLGTADRAFRRPGSQTRLEARFSKKKKLNQHWIDYANKHGYVETIPDRTVNPKRGYPVMCSRTEYGKISPTVPLNYHIQSSAMWRTRKAMVRFHREMRKWRLEEGFNSRIVLQVHDELDVAMPKLGKQVNLPRAKKLKELMELSGRDIGIPLKVSVSYHPNNWSQGESVC